VIIANNEWFESLSPGHQQIIKDAANLMAWTENLQKTEGDWRYSKKLQEELGMKIHVSTPEEKAAFKEITQKPVVTFIRSRVGDKLVDDLLSEVEAAKARLYQ
jgi:TRAP-type transport system periplasmic protein